MLFMKEFSDKTFVYCDDTLQTQTKNNSDNFVLSPARIQLGDTKH